VFVTFKDQSERKRSVQQIVLGPGGLQQRMFAEVEGGLAIANLPKAIEVSFRDAPYELILQNQDLDQLAKVSAQIANRIRAMTNAAGQPLLSNVRVGYEVDKPELRLSIDRNRAAALGVSIEDISRTLQILFGGLDLSRIKVAGKEYQVIVQLERASRLTPQDLDTAFVRGSKGELIQLSTVVKRETGAAPNAINHYKRLRSASITASPGAVPIGVVVKETEAMLASELPAGFQFAWGGDAKNLRDATTEVWWVLGLAAVIVYMTLAAQFESLIHPFTVMLALPLAAAGAFGALWLLDFGGKAGFYPPIPAMNVNLFSQIGLVLLVGLVTKNSILLVEFANQRRDAGAGAREAMLDAGRVRLRPILMTAFSTIAGILPIAIGFGAGAESRRPMGVAVVGGMLTSTFLTLFVIPVVYTLLSDLAQRVKRRSGVLPTPQPVTVGK
jgi:multidrug efflux pump